MNMHNFTRGAAINNPDRFRVLSDMDIRKVAPSVFATSAHESRSDRYAYVPTISVLEAMRKEDFLPVAVSQSRCRLADKREFTKHMLRFRRAGTQLLAVGDTVPEIVLVNAHDGSSAFKLYAAMFRLACSNGLVVCDSSLGDEISIPHKGDLTSRVIEGSFSVIDNAAKAGERAAEWKAITLEPPEQQLFARAALELRYDTDEKAPPINELQALAVRRNADSPNDLWTTFNRVQENLVRGGSRFTANGRRNRTRAVTGIDQNVKLNRALWQLAEGMKALKSA